MIYKFYYNGVEIDTITINFSRLVVVENQYVRLKSVGYLVISIEDSRLSDTKIVVMRKTDLNLSEYLELSEYYEKV